MISTAQKESQNDLILNCEARLFPIVALYTLRSPMCFSCFNLDTNSPGPVRPIALIVNLVNKLDFSREK